jgi:DNA-binding CsgD family transcriptional regulator
MMLKRLESLTAREQRVAQLAAAGLTNKEIAFELGLFVGTVKVHMHRIFQKLHISTRSDLNAAGQIPSSPSRNVAA